MNRFELPAEARALLDDLERARGEAARIRGDVERDLAEARRLLEREQRDVEKDAARALKRLEIERNEIEQVHDAVQTLLDSRVRGFELIAKAWNDYELARSRAQALALTRKSHPAKKAAEEVRAKGRELAKARRQVKAAEWALALYEWHFPWLAELRDLDWERSYVEGPQASEEDAAEERTDRVAHWLTAEEYAQLGVVERNQRALDRYLVSRKSPWEVGRDYERYVGYLREQEGFRVTYHGIFKGLEDLGRDLLAERDGEIEVIQCKRWSKHRTIHEKHVFQLFGTVIAMRIENPGKSVRGTFTTTTTLSERAWAFARQLDIRVEEAFAFDDYPRIKCNVARRTGERIYHLPFDQQYDTTTVEPDRGEFYAATVADAEAAGFRRAWRWRGHGQES